MAENLELIPPLVPLALLLPSSEMRPMLSTLDLLEYRLLLLRPPADGTAAASCAFSAPPPILGVAARGALGDPDTSAGSSVGSGTCSWSLLRMLDPSENSRGCIGRNGVMGLRAGSVSLISSDPEPLFVRLPGVECDGGFIGSM